MVQANADPQMNIVAQKRSDVFMSTTAFAAVLVVFVGSANVMSN